ncbi:MULTISPECIES: PepSY domain-containing protein [Streptomyces]|uniref:PepSY domain-containing protein n=1 Tax=Streptomyces TaxID=1883 RepID=UPI0006FC7756|nr:MULTISPECIES: PepSY domain-containing protein [Streptomyces]KQX91514.1 peptidase M4 [Streptomyces sp. Root1319]KQZ20073.1 peptidase M4 [Streptomyces sp. Root55]MDX3061434.1 PepSY domain-containing protein [Streptomyces sp. ND04-05B]WRY80315.1 PepSY domain-containing protein [Streptomyces clavifer]WUC26093.1 PepSY domain-containing protein [Streptomyces clavifer]
MRLETRRNKTVSSRTRRLRVVGALCAVLASALVTGCGQDSGDKTAAATSEAAKVIPKQTTTPSGSPSSTAQLTEAQTRRKDFLSTVKVTFDKAATTAVGEVSGGKLTEIDLEGLDDEDNASPSASPSESAGGDGSASPSPYGTPSPSGSASGSPSPSGSSTGPKWIAEVVEKDGTAHTVTIDAVSGDVIDSVPDEDQTDADKQQLADWLTKATQTPQQAAKVATDKKKGTVTSVDLDENDTQTLVWEVDVVTEDWNRTAFEVNAENGKITAEETDDN